MESKPTNPVLPQNRAEDLFTTFTKYGYAIFPQQKAIYEGVAKMVFGRPAIEAGAGNGVGSALMQRVWMEDGYSFSGKDFLATDVDRNNAAFGKAIYPWMNWEVWDLSKGPYKTKFDVVIAIEVVEHLESLETALGNLIKTAKDEVIFSTPNGTGKPHPPSNPHHVREYTPEEVLEVLSKFPEVSFVWVHNWDRLDNSNQTLATKKLGSCSLVMDIPLFPLSDPLVYRVHLWR